MRGYAFGISYRLGRRFARFCGNWRFYAFQFLFAFALTALQFINGPFPAKRSAFHAVQGDEANLVARVGHIKNFYKSLYALYFGHAQRTYSPVTDFVVHSHPFDAESRLLHKYRVQTGYQIERSALLR